MYKRHTNNKHVRQIKDFVIHSAKTHHFILLMLYLRRRYNLLAQLFPYLKGCVSKLTATATNATLLSNCAKMSHYKRD